MFKSFFQKKAEDPAKNGPPGPNQRNSMNQQQQQEQPPGGGFFNLPPPVSKQPTGTNGAGGAPVPGPPPLGSHAYSGGPPAAAVYGRSNQSQSYGAPPSYGPPSRHAAGTSHLPAGGPPAPGGAPSMFGGMSVRNPPSQGAPAQAPQQYVPSPVKNAPNQPAQSYSGGAGAAGAPITAASLSQQLYMETSFSSSTGAPASSGAAPAAAPGGSSLFSGLEVAAGDACKSAAPSGPTRMRRGSFERRKLGNRAGSSSSSASSFKRESMPASSTRRDSIDSTSTADNASPRSASGAGKAPMRHSLPPSGGRSSFAPKVKKKKKTFRPGFGRGLSEESIAALQRGELNEEELMQEQLAAQSNHQGEDTASVTSNSTSSSVLAGLTVHTASSPRAGAGSSVLAGLKVHSTMSPRNGSQPPSSSSVPQSGGGILAGLNVHSHSDDHGPKEEPVTSVIKHSSKPNTPEERLAVTLRDFYASAVTFRSSNVKQNEEENRLLERKLQLLHQMSQYEVDLKDVEAQQHHACEIEDFEKAEALNAAINSVRHCITLTESDLRKLDQETNTLIKNKEKAFAKQLKNARNVLHELEQFQSDQERARSDLRKKLKQFQTEETEQLQFETERIESEMHHVTVNLKHVAEEKQDIEKTIEEQCKDELDTRARITKEQQVIQLEIDALEAQLNAKKAQMAELQKEIDHADAQIGNVRLKFKRQLKRINDREKGVLMTKQEVESDAEALQNQRKHFETEVVSYEQKIANVTKQIGRARREIKAASLLTSVLEAQESRKEQANARKKAQQQELSSLSDATTVAEQAVAMLRNQQEEQEKALMLHTNAVASAESLIPRLEQEKKTAASARNFKEAARISKDIKALEKDRATAEEMVTKVTSELDELKERLEKREKEYEEKKQELKEVEKQLEVTALSELWKEARHLRRSLKKMKAKARAKRESDEDVEGSKTEGTDEEDVNFRTSAILLVQAELDACALQVEMLEKKYDMTDPAGDEEEDVSDEEEEEESDNNEDADVEDDESGSPGSKSEKDHGEGEPSSSRRGSSSHQDEMDEAEEHDTIQEIESKIVELESQIEKATEAEDYEKAAALDERIEALQVKRKSMVALKAAEESCDAARAAAFETSPASVSKDEVQVAPDLASSSPESASPPPASPTRRPRVNSNDPAVLEKELRELEELSLQIEQQIDEATAAEDYDKAAALDEELQGLHDRMDELDALLEAVGQVNPEAQQEAPSPANEVPPSEEPLENEDEHHVEEHDENVEDEEKNQRVASASTTEPSTESSSLFGGLQVNSSMPPPTEPIQEAPMQTSMFAGLMISGQDSVPAGSPSRLSPRKSSTLSPKESSTESVEDPSGSMFSGLQVNSSRSENADPQQSVEEQTAETSSMFSGLQVAGSPRKQSGTTSPRHHASVGMSAISSPTAKELSSSPRRRSSADSNKSGAEQNSLFSGLNTASPRHQSEDTGAVNMFASLQVHQATPSPTALASPKKTSAPSSPLTSPQNRSPTGSAKNLQLVTTTEEESETALAPVTLESPRSSTLPVNGTDIASLSSSSPRRKLSNGSSTGQVATGSSSSIFDGLMVAQPAKSPVDQPSEVPMAALSSPGSPLKKSARKLSTDASSPSPSPVAVPLSAPAPAPVSSSSMFDGLMNPPTESSKEALMDDLMEASLDETPPLELSDLTHAIDEALATEPTAETDADAEPEHEAQAPAPAPAPAPAAAGSLDLFGGLSLGGAVTSQPPQQDDKHE